MNPKNYYSSSDFKPYLRDLSFAIEISPTLDITTARILWCNDNTMHFSGYSYNEMHTLGFEFFRLVFHPDDMEKLSEAMILLSKGIVNECCNTYRVKPRNMCGYVAITGCSVLKNDGSQHHTCVFVNTFIITSRQQTGQYLRPDSHVQQNNDTALLPPPLTSSERKVAELIARGKTNKEIGVKLLKSMLTIKTQRAQIYTKLNVHNAAELTLVMMPWMDADR